MAEAASYAEWSAAIGSGLDSTGPDGFELDVPEAGRQWPRTGRTEKHVFVFDVDPETGHATARMHAGLVEATPVIRTSEAVVPVSAAPTQVVSFLLSRLAPALHLNPTFELDAAAAALSTSGRTPGPESWTTVLLAEAGRERTRIVLGEALARACVEISEELASRTGSRDLVAPVLRLVAATEPSVENGSADPDVALLVPEARYLVAWTLLVLADDVDCRSDSVFAAAGEDIIDALYDLADRSWVGWRFDAA